MAGLRITDGEPLPDPLSEVDRLELNKQTLKECIRLGWVEMAERLATPDERRNLRGYIAFCVEELSSVLRQLDELDA